MRQIKPYDPVIQFLHRGTGSPRNSLPRLCNTKPEEEEEKREKKGGKRKESVNIIRYLRLAR